MSHKTSVDNGTHTRGSSLASQEEWVQLEVGLWCRRGLRLDVEAGAGEAVNRGGNWPGGTLGTDLAGLAS